MFSTSSSSFDIQNLLQKWCPRIFLHSREKYFPIDIDWLMSQGTVSENGVVSKVNPSNRDLYNFARKYNFVEIAKGLTFDFPASLINGQFTNKKD